MSDRPPTGRTLATRRAIVDVVRSAVLTSYGVTGLTARDPAERLLAWLRLREPGIRVRLDRGLEIDLFVSVGYGLPIAEVARQIDAAVRYAVTRAFEREVRRLTVHVGGLRYQPASVPPTRDAPRATPAGAAAGSTGDPREGTDAQDRSNGHDPAAVATSSSVTATGRTSPRPPRRRRGRPKEDGG